MCALVAASLSLSLFGESGRSRRQETPTPAVCPVENLAPGGSVATKRAQRAALEEKLAAVEAEEDSLVAKATEAQKRFTHGSASTRAADRRKWNAAKAKVESKQQEAAGILASMAGLPEIPLVKPTSKEEWAKLPRSRREALRGDLLNHLDSAPEGHSVHEGFKFTVVSLKSTGDTIYDPFGKKILAALESESGDLPDGPEGSASVGNPSAEVRVVRLADGTPIGGMVLLMQAGAFKEDGGTSRFSSVVEAGRAGYDTGADVRWNVSARFNAKGELMDDQDTYWDWTGW